jgi:hypothetical protein
MVKVFPPHQILFGRKKGDGVAGRPFYPTAPFPQPPNFKLLNPKPPKFFNYLKLDDREKLSVLPGS